MVDERNCFNCRWSRWSGPHLGCWYNYEFRTWLRKKWARVVPLCETNYSSLLEGCKWEIKSNRFLSKDQVLEIIDQETSRLLNQRKAEDEYNKGFIEGVEALGSCIRLAILKWKTLKRKVNEDQQEDR